MFVLKSTHERAMREKNALIADLRLLLDNVSAKELQRAEKRVAKFKQNQAEALENALDFEETPVSKSWLDENDDKKSLPSRAEYEDRVNEAIKLFMARKNASYVAKQLDVAKKTARRYLKIAVAKRKVKKSDFETLNQ